jgi:hypothetical protein
MSDLNELGLTTMHDPSDLGLTIMPNPRALDLAIMVSWVWQLWKAQMH